MVFEAKGLIGVVHLPPMPGDAKHASGGFAEVEAHALADGRALAEGGVDAIIVENFGSAPFAKTSTEAHQVALLALVARRLKEETALPIGINCLRNDVVSALGIAAASGAEFVRVNVHTGAYVTDQGLIEGDAQATLRYRKRLGANTAICADVLVKHAAPLAPLSAEQATEETFDRGLADAVIVTGRGTGEPVDEALLREVNEAAQGRAVLIGSGLNLANAAALSPFASGAIVGTSLKHGGKLDAPVDPSRVAALKAACAFRGIG